MSSEAMSELEAAATELLNAVLSKVKPDGIGGPIYEAAKKTASALHNMTIRDFDARNPQDRARVLKQTEEQRQNGTYDWSCGHKAGAMCLECWSELARKANKLAEENDALREENDALRREATGRG